MPAKLFGLIGYPLSHSLSPVTQQTALDFNGIAGRFELWSTPPAKVAARVASLRKPEIMGACVTIPHKEAVIPYLDEIDSTAGEIGAVNTIVNTGGRLSGHNTDADGFALPLERQRGYSPIDKRVVVLGAGGAAKACVWALLVRDARTVALLNRTLDRAIALRDQLPTNMRDRVNVDVLTAESCHRHIPTADLLVNTTSVGMLHSQTEGRSPVPASTLNSGLMVYDIVYTPAETRLLADASAAGAQVLGGLPMLVYGGAISFEMWTGQRAPAGLMLARAEEALRKRS